MMLTSPIHHSGRRTVLPCNHRAHLLVGRGRRHSFPKNHSQRQGKRKIYTPLSGPLETSSHQLSRFHQTPSEGIPHRPPHLKNCLRYRQSLKCQLSQLTRLKSPRSLLQLSMREGRRLVDSPLTQLPMTTIQTTSLREETHGLEVLLLSVSRASASSGGRVVTRAPSPYPFRTPGRARLHPRTTPHLLHRLPSPLIRHRVNTLPFLHLELRLALILFWIASGSTRIQNTPFILIKAPRTRRPHKGHPPPRNPLILLPRYWKTRWGA